MTHIYPIDLTESHKNQSVKSISTLGTHYTSGASIMPTYGMGSHLVPILMHNWPLLINRPTQATQN